MKPSLEFAVQFGMSESSAAQEQTIMFLSITDRPQEEVLQVMDFHCQLQTKSLERGEKLKKKI
jgi:hypothetical protein